MSMVPILQVVLFALFGLMFYIAGNVTGGRWFAAATVVSLVFWLIVIALTTRSKR